MAQKISGDYSSRPTIETETIQLGPFRFWKDTEWAKWPDELKGVQVLNCCWGSDGNLYAATGNFDHPIAVLDTHGIFLKSIARGLFRKTHSVFFTKQHTLLVADADKNSHVIREISTKGTLIRTFGTEGKPGDSGYDFDYYEKLKGEGKVPSAHDWCKDSAAMARIDSIARRGGPFCRPCSMIQVADGSYYAADGYGNCAVHRFSSDGAYIGSWGQPGQKPGEFRIVHAILSDIYQRLWVADRENCRVQAFTMDGTLLAFTAGGMSRAAGLLSYGDYLFIGELDGGLTLLDLKTLSFAGQTSGAGHFQRIHGVCGDSEGNLYLSVNRWGTGKTNLIRLQRM